MYLEVHEDNMIDQVEYNKYTQTYNKYKQIIKSFF